MSNFTKEEAKESIIELLNNGYDGQVCDIHHEVFNTDYYIIGRYEAEEALKDYGIFRAIDEIVQFEKDNFGETFTDITEPEKVANMLWYIIGYDTINELESVREFSALYLTDDEEGEEARKQILNELE